jgi:hypothetical protein
MPHTPQSARNLAASLRARREELRRVAAVALKRATDKPGANASPPKVTNASSRSAGTPKYRDTGF